MENRGNRLRNRDGKMKKQLVDSGRIGEIHPKDKNLVAGRIMQLVQHQL
jgi:ribosomal protein S26